MASQVYVTEVYVGGDMTRTYAVTAGSAEEARLKAEHWILDLITATATPMSSTEYENYDPLDYDGEL